MYKSLTSEFLQYNSIAWSRGARPPLRGAGVMPHPECDRILAGHIPPAFVNSSWWEWVAPSRDLVPIRANVHFHRKGQRCDGLTPIFCVSEQT